MNYDEIVALVADKENAVTPRSGRFEGNPDARIAEALYELTLEDTLDAWSGDSNGPQGWNARVGRFLLHEDSDGFFSYRIFESDLEAEKTFEREHGAVYDDGA